MYMDRVELGMKRWATDIGRPQLCLARSIPISKCGGVVLHVTARRERGHDACILAQNKGLGAAPDTPTTHLSVNPMNTEAGLGLVVAARVGQSTFVYRVMDGWELGQSDDRVKSPLVGTFLRTFME